MSNNAASAQPYPGFVVLRSGGSVRLATLGRRFFARVVDVGILLVVSVPLLWQLVGALDSRTVRPESARASIGGALRSFGASSPRRQVMCAVRSRCCAICRCSSTAVGGGRRGMTRPRAAW